jgi:hypothetical protein
VNCKGLFGDTLPEGPLAVTETEPLQTVALGMPAGFAETVKVELFVPADTALTVSQLLVQPVAAVMDGVAAIELSALLLLLVIVTACEGAVLTPVSYGKFIGQALFAAMEQLPKVRTIWGSLLTVSFTGIWMG